MIGQKAVTTRGSVITNWNFSCIADAPHLWIKTCELACKEPPVSQCVIIRHRGVMSPNWKSLQDSVVDFQ